MRIHYNSPSLVLAGVMLVFERVLFILCYRCFYVCARCALFAFARAVLVWSGRCVHLRTVGVLISWDMFATYRILATIIMKNDNNKWITLASNTNVFQLYYTYTHITLTNPLRFEFSNVLCSLPCLNQAFLGFLNMWTLLAFMLYSSPPPLS